MTDRARDEKFLAKRRRYAAVVCACVCVCDVLWWRNGAYGHLIKSASYTRLVCDVRLSRRALRNNYTRAHLVMICTTSFI